MQILNNRTLSFWFKSKNPPKDGSRQALIGKHYKEYQTILHENNLQAFYPYGPGKNEYARITAYPNGRVPSWIKDKWYHIVWVSDDTTNYVYIDGRLTEVFDRKLSEEFAGSHDFYMGVMKYSTTLDLFFEGLIDDVKLYDIALTSEEVGSLSGKKPEVVSEF